ncbi:MAG: hypothetical protein ACRYGB_01310 [Janthinobacterium lividum]
MALQNSNLAVWEMNLDDYTVNRSSSHDALFGLKIQPENWHLDDYLALLLPEDALRLEELIRDLPEDGLLGFAGRISIEDGEIKWMQFQGKCDQQRNHRLLLGTIKDITREKIAERHKDEFISMVSHELKTPITSIKAIKYSPGKNKVTIDACMQNGQLVCSVQDNGIGIAPEKQSHILSVSTVRPASRII